MSYILDALRKAEAERERGQLPGLHSAAATPRLPERRLLVQVPPGWPMLAGLGALVAAGGLGGWAWLHRLGIESVDAPSVMTAQPLVSPTLASPPVAAPSSSARPLAATSPTLPTAPRAPTSPTALASQASPASALKESDRGPAAVAAGPASSRTVTASPATAMPPAMAIAAVPPASVPPTPTSAAVVPPEDGRIHAVDDLPADIRRELPKLDFGGLVQLDNPPRRSLIVNGAILMEGELVQPNLVLEQIRLNGAVLRFKGWRFQLPL